MVRGFREMTNCDNFPHCKSTEFTMLIETHQWICKECGLGQLRFNCGFHHCCKDFYSIQKLNQHLSEMHSIRK